MADEETAVATEKPTTADQSPEEQLVADETAALTQLNSTSEPLRHSVTPAVSDFTGISNPTNLLASLSRWHAQGQVNGLILNEKGGGIPHAWRLTHLGSTQYVKNQAIPMTPPTLTGLAPATASIAAAAGKPVTVVLTGTEFRGTQVVQVGGVTIPATYNSPTQFTAKYTLPASAQTVQFSVHDGVLNVSTANQAFTVTA